MPEALNVDPALLRANSFNVNIVAPANEEKLEASIDRFGLFKPIIVRSVPGIPGWEILGGEHRWEAACRRRLKEVPIFDLGPIDDKTAIEIAMADNARYGTDDTMALGELLRSHGLEDIGEYLPWSETDVNALFSSNIALDELDLPDGLDETATKDEPEAPITKAPKTHTIMRFKVPLADAERLEALIAQTKGRLGFTESDDLTNAGDALVHLLISGAEHDE